jgi:hypothetical protein
LLDREMAVGQVHRGVSSGGQGRPARRAGRPRRPHCTGLGADRWGRLGTPGHGRAPFAGDCQAGRAEIPAAACCPESVWSAAAAVARRRRWGECSRSGAYGVRRGPLGGMVEKVSRARPSRWGGTRPAGSGRRQHGRGAGPLLRGPTTAAAPLCKRRQYRRGVCGPDEPGVKMTGRLGRSRGARKSPGGPRSAGAWLRHRFSLGCIGRAGRAAGIKHGRGAGPGSLRNPTEHRGRSLSSGSIADGG